MSDFWSGWVIFFVVFNWTLVTFLLVIANRVRIPTRGDGTTGHVWAHGVIREGVRALPMWWIIMSAACLIFGVVYLYLYPGFGKASGSMGWTSETELQARIDEHQQQSAAFIERVQTQSLTQLGQQADVLAAGGVLFDDNCAACHGQTGQGNSTIGAPNLRDDIWQFGDSEQIRLSIENGRRGVMPAFSSLSDIQVHEVAEYVYSLNGRTAEHAWLQAAGKKRFDTACAVCHGAQGEGNPQLGAPALNDDDWLYGGSMYAIKQSIRHGRQGHMPAWKERLSATDIRMLMAWLAAQTDTEDGRH